MIGSTRALRVHCYGQPCDMRRGFDSLFGLVRSELGRDPLSGDMFVFVSRNRQRAKVLLWDGTGLCLYAKRLESGRFARIWSEAGGEAVELTMSELSLFLEGSEMVGKVRLSPQKFELSGLHFRDSDERIEYGELGEHQRLRHPEADRCSP
jgi:transposase